MLLERFAHILYFNFHICEHLLFVQYKTIRKKVREFSSIIFTLFFKFHENRKLFEKIVIVPHTIWARSVQPF